MTSVQQSPRAATTVGGGGTGQFPRSRGLSVTGRVMATIGAALLLSAVWTPWFFALVGTAVVLSGVALLEYGGPYSDNPPTLPATPGTSVD